MALLLREAHVTELLDIETAIAAVEEVLRDQAEGQATNRPRYRVAMPASQLHVMAAGDKRLGVTGLKAYTASRKGARFLVLVYDAESADMLAMIEADRLGRCEQAQRRQSRRGTWLALMRTQLGSTALDGRLRAN